MLCLRNHLNPELDGNSMTQAGIILVIAVLGYWVLRLILEGIGTLLGGGVSAVDGIAKSKMTKNAERRFNQETIKWTKEKNKHEQIQHEQIKQQKAEAKRKYDLESKKWVDADVPGRCRHPSFQSETQSQKSHHF